MECRKDRDVMKDELKNIFLMGLGAMAMTSEKASELKKELLDKGEKLYKDGQKLNSELKHNIEEKIKDSVTVVVNNDVSKESIIDAIDKMSEDDRIELMKILSKKNNSKDKSAGDEKIKKDKKDE